MDLNPAATDAGDEILEARALAAAEAQVGTEAANRIGQRSRSMLEPPAAAGQFELVSSPRYAFPHGFVHHVYFRFPEPAKATESGVLRWHTNKAGILARSRSILGHARKKYPANVVGPKFAKCA